MGTGVSEDESGSSREAAADESHLVITTQLTNREQKLLFSYATISK